jgi:hypothetical protein
MNLILSILGHGRTRSDAALERMADADFKQMQERKDRKKGKEK